MLKSYLAQGAVTATERLVAQGSDVFKSSTAITAGEKLCLKAAYLDQLVKQTQRSDSNRLSASSDSTS
jgi:hypothetical protein